MKVKLRDSDIAQKRKDVTHLKRQNELVKRKQKENKVVGQGSLQQTMFADDGNGTPYVSSWRVSACGRQIAHLTGSTTRTFPPKDSKNCGTESRYHKRDIKLKLKQTDSNIAPYKKLRASEKGQILRAKRKNGD